MVVEALNFTIGHVARVLPHRPRLTSGAAMRTAASDRVLGGSYASSRHGGRLAAWLRLAGSLVYAGVRVVYFFWVLGAAFLQLCAVRGAGVLVRVVSRLLRRAASGVVRLIK